MNEPTPTTSPLQDNRDWLGHEAEVRRHEGRVMLTRSGSLTDWWTITKAEHEGISEFRPTKYGRALYLSERLSDCCIEGPLCHMQGLARAIRAGESAEYRRCAVEPYGGGFVLWSPRNDHFAVGWITADTALELAEQIEQAQLPKVTP